jgi:Holliday junction resolvase-like predicted endonuclease
MHWMGWHDVLLGLATAVLVLSLRSSSRRRRLRDHFQRASHAEKAAATWLARRGYRILEVQPQKNIRFRIGSRLVGATVRADYLVQRRLRRYVVEVKSGEVAPDPSSRATRRQLREYCAVFPYAVLLLDTSAGTLTPVEFLDGKGRGWGSTVARFGLAFLAWWLLDLAFR